MAVAAAPGALTVTSAEEHRLRRGHSRPGATSTRCRGQERGGILSGDRRIMTMRPGVTAADGRADPASAAARTLRHDELTATFTSSCSRNSSMGRHSSGPGRAMPALLTRPKRTSSPSGIDSRRFGFDRRHVGHVEPERREPGAKLPRHPIGIVPGSNAPKTREALLDEHLRRAEADAGGGAHDDDGFRTCPLSGRSRLLMAPELRIPRCSCSSDKRKRVRRIAMIRCAPIVRFTQARRFASGRLSSARSHSPVRSCSRFVASTRLTSGVIWPRP